MSFAELVVLLSDPIIIFQVLSLTRHWKYQPKGLPLK